MAGRLDGKVAVITGGAGGIGSATAKLYFAEGATVILVGRNEDTLRKTAADIGNDRVGHVVADVADDDQVKGYVDETVNRYGRIDVLFSNAGTEGVVAPIVDYPMDVYDKVIAVNLRGIFSSLKHGIPAIAAGGGGSIILSSSIGGLRGFASLAPYATTKHGLVGMMRSAVLECADNGVRINTVHPGPVNTRMMRSVETGVAPGAEADVVKQFESMIPQGRYAEPDEVGQVVVFLGSDESRHLTGATISIDGGMSVA